MSEVRRFADPVAVADATVAEFVELAGAAVRHRGRFCVALPGGSTPRALYRALAGSPLCEQMDWTRVEVFWGTSGRYRRTILSRTMAWRETCSSRRSTSQPCGSTASRASWRISRKRPGNTSRRSRGSSAYRRRVPLRLLISSCSAWVLTATRPRSSRTAGRYRCDAAGQSPTIDPVSGLTESL